MFKKKLIILSITIAIITSCAKKKEVEYYADGSIKYQVELSGGKRNGLMVEHYENGKLKSKGEWKNGMSDGKTEHYYENGDLKSISFWEEGNIEGVRREFYDMEKIKVESNWKNGKQHGVTKKYHVNGELKSVGMYEEDKRVIVDYFDEESRLFERQGYDANDRLAYIASYDTLGNKEYGFPIALFTSEKDTITLSERYNVKVYFGLPMQGVVRAYTGEREEGTSNLLNRVQLEEIEPYVFQYSYKPEKTGSFSIPFKFEHDTDESDTLSVDGLNVKHGIYVVDDSINI